MRIRLFASSCLLSLLTWAACASDPSESGPPDPPSDGAPPANGGTGVINPPGGSVLAADASAAPQRDTGAPVALPDTGTPSQAEAGAEGGAPAQVDAGPQSACPRKYSTAMYLAFDVSWQDSVGFWGGKAPVEVWTKVTFTPAAGGGATTEMVPCGTANPIITSSPLVGGEQFASDIPVSAFEQPSMPRFAGRATWQQDRLVIDPGTAVLGASLSDPEGAWPFRASLSAVDHDGDGKPGLTALQRKDPPFGFPPADIGFTKYLDKVYVASRIRLRLTGASEGCGGPVEGSAEPLAFNYTVVGCHIVDGDDCGEREVSLIENQNPVFTLGSSGRWKSVPIAENASCADVVNALPAE